MSNRRLVYPPSWKLWVAVQFTTSRGLGHIVSTPLQAAQLVLSFSYFVPWLFFVCNYQCKWWSGKTRLRNVLHQASRRAVCPIADIRRRSRISSIDDRPDFSHLRVVNVFPTVYVENLPTLYRKPEACWGHLTESHILLHYIIEQISPVCMCWYTVKGNKKIEYITI